MKNQKGFYESKRQALLGKTHEERVEKTIGKTQIEGTVVSEQADCLLQLFMSIDHVVQDVDHGNRIETPIRRDVIQGAA